VCESEWVPLNDVGDVDPVVATITEQLLNFFTVLVAEDDPDLRDADLSQILNRIFKDWLVGDRNKLFRTRMSNRSESRPCPARE
jgi:hypothetical protein